MAGQNIQESEAGQEILRGLPGWMPTEPGGGNYNLLDVVGKSVDKLNDDIDTLDNSATVQEAETVEQLEKLASMVDLPRETDEAKERYRARLIAEYQKLTNEATVEEILRNTATILGVEKEAIGLSKESHGSVKMTVPGRALDNTSLNSSDFSELMTEMVAAGFTFNAVRGGTFTYITPSEYGNSNFDSSRGYDGLDANGEPKNTGGTYAGLID
jgi:hypothetical protein